VARDGAPARGQHAARGAALRAAQAARAHRNANSLEVRFPAVTAAAVAAAATSNGDAASAAARIRLAGRTSLAAPAGASVIASASVAVAGDELGPSWGQKAASTWASSRSWRHQMAEWVSDYLAFGNQPGKAPVVAADNDHP
jgi:hypothetical protein